MPEQLFHRCINFILKRIKKQAGIYSFHTVEFHVGFVANVYIINRFIFLR
jgi:hypothetical protein